MWIATQNNKCVCMFVGLQKTDTRGPFQRRSNDFVNSDERV